MTDKITDAMVDAAREAYAVYDQIGDLRAQKPSYGVTLAMLHAAEKARWKDVEPEKAPSYPYSDYGDNWIEWRGAPWSGPQNAVVSVKLKSGKFWPALLPRGLRWDHQPGDNANIIAYRIDGLI
jgi:hypothetical protein